MKQKKIILLTRNALKLEEYQHFFKNYNVAVEMLNDFGRFKNSESLIKNYFYLLERDNILSVLFDETILFDEQTNKRINRLSEKNDGQLVYAQTTLYYLKGEDVLTFTSQPHLGVIDYSARKKEEQVFGWDDIFILRPLGVSYHELKQRGMKNHSREDVLSDFAQSHLYFTKLKEMKFNAFSQKEVVDFSFQIFDFVGTNKWLNTPSVKEAQLDRLFQYALNNGGFFRAAKNRRQKNYWTPGLNAGIPLVAKKDEIHEITFFVHDMCHFVQPDLIYSGEQHPLYDKVYIIHRMLSEAITLVLADMLFVETLEKEGVDYDFSKRKIYPLYQAIKRKNKDVKLEKLLQANIAYCILGHDNLYRDLIHPEDEKYLLDFQQKYERFFKEDFRWTNKNIQGMKQNATYFRSWYKANKSAFDQQGLMSIEVFTKENLQLTESTNIHYTELVRLISQQAIQHFLKVMQGENNQSHSAKLSNSFKKYLLGQMLLFYKMDFLNYSKFLAQKFFKAIVHDTFDENKIQKYRQLYTDYLNMLKSYHLIHQDDVETYQEVYPIFDSFYVFYDQKKTVDLTLADVAKRILE